MEVLGTKAFMQPVLFTLARDSGGGFPYCFAVARSISYTLQILLWIGIDDWIVTDGTNEHVLDQFCGMQWLMSYLMHLGSGMRIRKYCADIRVHVFEAT